MVVEVEVVAVAVLVLAVVGVKGRRYVTLNSKTSQLE